METLLHAGLSNAVSAAFLAMLVACLARVLARRPAILHCLWLLVLLKLVTPPLYEVPISWPETLTATAETPAEAEPCSIGRISDVYFLEVADVGEPSALHEPAAHSRGLDLLGALDVNFAVEKAGAMVAYAGQWLSLHWMPLVAAIWLMGTIATVVISARRIIRFQILLREAQPGTGEIQDWVDELSASLGIEHSPRVWWINGKLSPMLWALFGRPRLIIPTDLWKTLDQRQRGTLLVHELAHLRRGDHRVRFFELAVTALYWWNPVLWWARQALRDVEEQCCDAWVVWAFPEAAKSYAETLLETLDFLNQSELSEPLLASGFGKVQHLRRRLTMIMSGTTPRLLSAWGALGALSLGALLLPVNATWAQKADEKKEVRVIVKSDDDAKTVFVPAGALEATGTFIVSDEPDVVHTDIFVNDPNKLSTVNFVLSDDVVVTGDDAKSEQVSVILKTDDSSVSVSADSIDDAIKKIKEQINSLSEKGSLGDKEKAQQEALTKIAKQLAEIAKSNKLTTAKGDGNTQKRIVIRKVEDIKTTDASPEKKAQIEKARSKIKELSKALAAAQADLAKLEGHSAHTFAFVTPDHKAHANAQYKVMALPKLATQDMNVTVHTKIEKDVADAVKAGKRAVVKVEPRVTGKVRVVPDQEIEVRTIRVPDGGEDRIQALEKKLNQLLEEVANLKKSKAD